MADIQYTRSKGRKLTYDLWYDASNYEIRQDGELKKRGALPVLVQGPALPPEELADLGRIWAIRDIEDLVGMDE